MPLRARLNNQIHCRSRREEAQNSDDLAKNQSLLTSAPTILRHALRKNWFTSWLVLLLVACSVGQNRSNAELVATSSEDAAAIKTLDTPRDFPTISSPGEWQARAKDIRQQVLVSCGLWPMPGKTALKPHIFDKVRREGYSVEKVYFQTLPGFYLAGNLYRPLGRGKGPFPAILNPHGHWKEGRLADSKDGSIPARCISFARQGMIAFSYDMVGFNDTHFPNTPTNQPFYESHRQFGTNRTDLLWNISLMALQTWNSIRALDFLEALPDVDRKRLACTGESGGGTQTFILGAVDDRLAAQVPVVMVSHTMQGGCSCENAPGLRVEYSNMEIAAAAAPRPQMLVAATGDWTKDTIKVEGPAIKHIYDLLNAPENFNFVRFDFGHNYNQTSREAVYEWLAPRLLGESCPTSLKEPPYQKEPDSDLRVFPDGKLPADALSQEQLIHLMIQRWRAQWRSLKPTSTRKLEKFKEAIFPVWRHTLLVDWPQKAVWEVQGSESDSNRTQLLIRSRGQTTGTRAQWSVFSSGPRATLVVLALSAADDTRPELNSLARTAKLLAKLKISYLTVDPFPVLKTPSPFTNFFSTYNRTETQEQVRNLVNACAVARDFCRAERVILCGLGRAGLWALLAAPSADAVIADGNQLDAGTDDDSPGSPLLAPELFCPGILRMGGFEGAALLAAPHPLFLHNTAANFQTETLSASYKALHSANKLRVQRQPLADEELTDWVSRLRDL